MAWWQWTAAAAEAVLVTILVLLWHDALREKRHWRLAEHPKMAVATLAMIPVLTVAVLLSPWWLAVLLLATPTVIIAVLLLVG